MTKKRKEGEPTKRSDTVALTLDMFEPEDLERFWSGVSVLSEEECWPWVRYCNKDGYGFFRLQDKVLRSHRVAYLLENGWLPDEIKGEPALVLHSCDNRACCYPSHLFLGTDEDNNKDAVMKGRLQKSKPGNKGILNPSAKLTEVQVREIKLLHRKGFSQRDIAKEYGVSFAAINKIVKGINWSYVTI